MTIKLSSFGGGGLKLAPDLNYIANLTDTNTDISPFLQTGNIDGTSGFATAISLAGKFSFSALQIENNITESYTLKLTVDGNEIWNSSNTLGANANIIGAIADSNSSTSIAYAEPFICNTSLLLEVTSTTDASFRFNYIARPIL